MFKDLIKNIETANKDLQELKDEAERLSKGENGELKGDKKSRLKPMTKLRNNVEEINQEKENPELTKIKDRLESIIEGIFK